MEMTVTKGKQTDYPRPPKDDRRERDTRRCELMRLFMAPPSVGLRKVAVRELIRLADGR
jgi:hypothetical protein